MTRYVIEADPGGPRIRAQVLTALTDAGASPDQLMLEESRGGEQVLEVLRLGFEFAGDIALVHSGLKALQARFPGLRLTVREDPPQGRHQAPD